MTRKELLARERAELSRRLTRVLADTDTTQTQVAEACGRGRQKATRWCDPEDSLVPTVADLRLMPAEVVRGLLVWVGAAHGLRVVDEVDDEATQADYVHALAHMVKETADVSATFAEAIADGAVTPAEARCVVREADEAIRAIDRVRSQAEAVAVSNVAVLGGR